MLKILDWCARALLVAVTAIVIYRVWVFLAPSGADSFVRTDLIGADRADALYTGFASLPVVEFKGDKGLVPFEQLEEKASSVRGFCYRVYDVAIGYPSLRDARAASEEASAAKWDVLAPQVLAANIVEARHGGKTSQYECDAVNLVTSDRPRAVLRAELQALLAHYGQWESQATHGKQMLTLFSQRLKEARRAEMERRAASPRVASGAPGPGGPAAASPTASQAMTAGGTLGSIKLTLSAIAIFSQQKGWVFRSNEFYVRQDNADVTYGSDLLLDIDAQRPLFGRPALRVKLPEPRLLAIDRYTTVLATNKKSFEVRDAEPDAQNRDPVEAAISDALARQLERLTPQAIRVARDLLVSQIHDLAPDDVTRIEIEFTGASLEEGAALLEVLRRLTDEGGTQHARSNR